MKIEITGLDALAKSIDNLSISLVSLKFPRSMSVVNAEKVEVAAPKKAAKKKVTPVEVVTRTEAELTAKAKELIAAFSPSELRAILDDVVGAGVKISSTPKEKYNDLYDAINAKIAS
tara:strand:- start:1558 stop:1908 length:351 start_codon:yes stop_codon:yes gene_type:complete